ncbi:MAG: DMT family transporter [Caulobacterales bacterium]|nr:DMT family transporter [Caulobacterales bacterium]
MRTRGARRRMRLAALTAIAICAFAGNSLLTRAALGDGLIGAGAFAGIRLISGAVVLLAFGLMRRQSLAPTNSALLGATFLFAYAAAFSFAYLELDAASGALILFGSVQIAMAGAALLRGARYSAREYLGVAIAFAGLVFLLAPRVGAPAFAAAALMAGAGAAWAGYTVNGKYSGETPVQSITLSFLYATPAAALLLLTMNSHATTPGVLLAVASGAGASALGYLIWYLILPSLSIATAGAAQLLAPVVTALGAALLLGERVSTTLALAGALIIAGIALTLRK